MKSFITAYLLTALSFLGGDAAWLSATAQRVYRPMIGDLLAERPNIYPAALFYAIYITGLVVLVVYPNLQNGQWTTIAARGALLGLMAYSTYDLTNQATLRDWPVTITIIDLFWGSFLTAFAATIGCLATRALTRT